MAEEPHIPTLLERAKVPQHFPLFRNTAALAHLAHNGKGPPYVLVGGKAWYEVSDITAWIDRNKVRRANSSELIAPPPKPTRVGLKKRGRPTKMEQYYRQVQKASHTAS
jgi:hypothetical protein